MAGENRSPRDADEIDRVSAYQRANVFQISDVPSNGIGANVSKTRRAARPDLVVDVDVVTLIADCANGIN